MRNFRESRAFRLPCAHKSKWGGAAEGGVAKSILLNRGSHGFRVRETWVQIPVLLLSHMGSSLISPAQGCSQRDDSFENNLVMSSKVICVEFSLGQLSKVRVPSYIKILNKCHKMAQQDGALAVKPP